MESQELIDITKEAMWVLLKLSLPILVAILIVGFVMALGQAVTQIHEPAVSFIPKMLAVFMTLLLSFSYMGHLIGQFFEQLVSVMLHLE